MPVTFGEDISKEFDPTLTLSEQAELDGYFEKPGAQDETEVTQEGSEEEEDYSALLGEWAEDDEDEDAQIEEEARKAVAEMEKANRADEIHRDVEIDDNALDHIILGVSNIEKGIEQFEKLTGVKPVMVFSHNGLGCKSARLSFQESVFVEIMGPDPKQPGCPLHKKLAALPEDEFVPFHYAIRNSKATKMKIKELPDMGFDCDHITMYGRQGEEIWQWDEVFLGGHQDGGLVPFLIDWGESEHACCKLPVVGNLESVTVSAPAKSHIHKLLDGVKGINVEEGDDMLVFKFSSDEGVFDFTCAAPGGITFPDESPLEE